MNKDNKILLINKLSKQGCYKTMLFSILNQENYLTNDNKNNG